MPKKTTVSPESVFNDYQNLELADKVVHLKAVQKDLEEKRASLKAERSQTEDSIDLIESVIVADKS